MNMLETTKTLKLLSIDGGGVRGLIVARILYRIEHDLHVNIYEHFDMFAGTSVGSMIIGSIVYSRYNSDKIETMFSPENIKKMMKPTWKDLILSNMQMGPKYGGEYKRRIIEETVGENTLMDTDKRVMIPCYSVELQKTVFFKSWNNFDGCNKVLDIVDASSSAPSYFPGVDINGKSFVDGAVASNNPTDVAYCELLKKSRGLHVKILSIGTGEVLQPKYTGTNMWGGLQWAMLGNIFALVMKGTEDAVDIIVSNLSEYLGHDYIRINGFITSGSIDDTSDENIAYLKKTGDKWFDQNKDKLNKFFSD